MTDETLDKASQGNARLRELLRHLSPEQVRFLAVRLYASSDADAARQMGISEQAPWQWRHRGAPIDEALDLLKYDGVIMASKMFHDALLKAVMIKIDGLDVRDKRLQQQISTEIIERTLGKALERRELSGPDGAPLLDLQAMVEALRQADEALSGGDDGG